MLKEPYLGTLVKFDITCHMNSIKYMSGDKSKWVIDK